MWKRSLSRISLVGLALALVGGWAYMAWSPRQRQTTLERRLLAYMAEREANFDSASKGAREGYEIAELHIRHRVGFTLVSGMRLIGETNYSTPDGLPLYGIAGCTYGQDDYDRRWAYEERISDYLASGGQFENSIRPWLDDFQDLAAFWDKLAADRPTQRLAHDARSATSPDGRSTLRVARRPAHQDWPESFHLILSTEGGLPLDDGGSVDWVPVDQHATLRVVWGPEGSAFALVRAEVPKRRDRPSDSVVLNALDLRSGHMIARHAYDVDDGTLRRRKVIRWRLTN